MLKLCSNAVGLSFLWKVGFSKLFTHNLIKTNNMRLRVITRQNITNLEEKTFFLTQPVFRSSLSHQNSRNKIPCSLANMETAVSVMRRVHLMESLARERGDQETRSREDTRNREVYRRSALDHF